MGLKYKADKFESSLNTFRGLYSNPSVDEYQGSVLIPLDFSLEMEGISGIIPNSAFEIPKNSLPISYLVKNGEDKGKSRIAFILHAIDHNINNNKWTTKITGQTLNIRFDELTEAEKEAIKKAQTPAEVTVKTLIEGAKEQASAVTVASNSSATGDNIPVVKYLKGQSQQNGRIANQYLRNLKIPDDPTSNRIHKLFPTAATQWERLIAAARKDGFKVSQTNISYLSRAAYRGPTSNNSIHGWGIAVDIQSILTAQGGPKSFNNIRQAQKVRETNAFYKWLNQNASNYGWVNPSWAKDGVKMEETWHWEYHGPAS